MTAVAPPPNPSRGREAFQWLSLAAIVLLPIAAIAWLAWPSPTCACSSLPPSSFPPSPVEGVVVAVDSSGLGDVAGFTIRTHADAVIDFQLGALENPTEFPPTHLAEHLASSQPVRVFFRLEDSGAVAYRLEDASP